LTTRTWRTKRRIGAAALVALIGSALAFASPASAVDPGDTFESARISGADRYATAADAWLNEDGWNADCDDIVVVNGDNFPDGLSASIYYSPILLVKADSIPAATAAAITAQETDCGGFGDITVVGGTSVVSSAVLEDLDNLIAGDVVRVAGEDRYSTAAAVAADVLARWADTSTCDMILATGDNFPDALAAGPLAIYADAPILLNTGGSLLPVVKATIAGALGTGNTCDLGVPTVHIVGGTAAVPASVEAELQSMGINVNRIAGANRAETAAAIASTMNVLGYGADHVVLVNGNGFADALAAGPMAYWNDGVIMPVNADSIPAAVAAWHVANCDDLDYAPEIRAVGGTAVISDEVVAGAGAAATCTGVSFTATLANLGNTQAVYTANGAGPGADGVTFTAVAGNAADGAAGNDWAITIEDTGMSTVGVEINSAAKTAKLRIDDFTADGISQADLVALWNADPGASALFTAAPDGSSGSPADYTGGAITMDVTDAGTTTQQVVITFNVDVRDTDAPTGEMLEATDFSGLPGGTLVASSPLPSTVGAEDVYSFTYVMGAVGDLASVGDTVAVDTAAFSLSGVEDDALTSAAAEADLTAG
jgi:putative cell wall-binding protein